MPTESYIHDLFNVETMSNNRRRHITPTHRIGRHIAAVAITLIALAACHNPSPLRRLGGVDSLVNSRPDSALTLLNSIAQDTAEMSRRDLMRYYLLRTNAENKCDTVLTARHAALMRRVCDYYDRHSSKREANNRMLAHYLLGRCYSDMGEAPVAMYEFNNAADVADTTDVHSDYATLLRAHSQLAFIFYMQDLYDLQLSELNEVISLSKKVKDFRSEMWAYESVATVLEAKGKRKESLRLLDSVHTELLQHGYRSEAARTSGLELSILVDMGRYDSIASKLHEYERYSGYFDPAGDIEPTKALYYVYKGIYLLHCGKADSAVMLFRKSLHTCYSLETRLAGAKELESFYGKKNVSDSIVKYARLSSRLNDSLRLDIRTAALAQQENSHKYASLQKQADWLRLKNEQAKRHRQLLIFIFIVIVLVGGYFGMGWYTRIKSLERDKKEKQRELERIRQTYLATLERHEDALSALQLLKDKNTDINKRHQEEIKERENNLSEMASEINSLKKKLEDAENKMHQMEKIQTIQQVDDILSSLDALQHISICLSENPPRSLSPAELRHLREEFREKYPSFYQQLVIGHRLPLKKYDFCLLYRLNIKPANIATLLGVKRSSATMERHRIYESIFGRPDEGGEFMAFLRGIL